MTDKNTTTAGTALDWDSTIENDSSFELLPEGDYEFTVTKFERSRHHGSAKLPECNKAVLTLELKGANGIKGVITHNLFLHSSTEGMLCAFFAAIGSRKHGEPLKMNWDDVQFANGRAKVGTRKWKGDDGEERSSNEVKKFYPSELKKAVQTFEAGRF